MKKQLLLFAIMLLGVSIMAQNYALKPNLKSNKLLIEEEIGVEPQNNNATGMAVKINPNNAFKSTDVVSIVSAGTSANAYGFINASKSNVCVNNDLNTVTIIHRMGGALDPGGYSGDLGYDVSTDGGMTWTPQTEIYTAQINAGGTYYIDAARYPHHGIYNPPGNTDPNEAYVAYFGCTTSGTNGDTWGGYCWGRAKIGDPLDTTRHFLEVTPEPGMNLYVPQGYTLNNLGEFWVSDLNEDWASGALVFNNEMVISHGIWNDDDFDVDIFTLECITQAAASAPANQKIEFSPDGQIGYIVVLSDNGEIDISKDQSYYPIIWRTEDAGATWSDPIAVAIAGEDGIGGVQNYLSDEEIAELFVEPLPERYEIPFTTAFDCDLSVDMYGNPHIAVVCGVTSSTPYAILTGISPSSGYAFTSMFLLSSMDKGNQGSWIGYELGRPVSFRGTFNDITEDNRIQIARDPAGTKMFVSWLDTDTTVSSENNAPDIWTRGVDVVNHTLTVNEDGNSLPNNVTFGSEGTFSAYIFAMANEVFFDGVGNYTLPFVYLNMNPADPLEQVQYKYVQDFQFNNDDFIITDIGESQIGNAKFTEVSQTTPNPASTVARFDITLSNPANVSVLVTNMMGQTVKTLPAKSYQAGTNTIALNVSDLTSGVYFYTVKAGKETITKKMVVK